MSSKHRRRTSGKGQENDGGKDIKRSKGSPEGKSSRRASPEEEQMEGRRDVIGRRVNPMNMYQAQLKEEIRPPHVEKHWAKLLEMLERGVEEVLAAPDKWIPEIEFDDVKHGAVPKDVIDKIKRTGVVKIRRVVPKDVANSMNESIMSDFQAKYRVDPADPASYSDNLYNKKDIKAQGFGGVQEMFYHKAQVEARQHVNMRTVKTFLNSLWVDLDPDTGERVFVPELDLTYVDRWRHRLPACEEQTGIKEHLDNGSLSRWADPSMRMVYAKAFEGEFEEFNPWVAGGRCLGSDSFFRTFQGWLALTPQGPGQGTLEVVPLLKECIAYILLRPFAADVASHHMCGVTAAAGKHMLEITSKWHSAVLRAKVSIGHVEAGDTVWWHPDVVHGVEETHSGPDASNVIYVVAAPMCKQNARYLVRQREAFRNGVRPPDFEMEGCEKEGRGRGSKRGKEQEAVIGCVTGEEDLSPLGKRQMGVSPWMDRHLGAGGAWGKKHLLKECNEILFG